MIRSRQLCLAVLLKLVFAAKYICQYIMLWPAACPNAFYILVGCACLPTLALHCPTILYFYLAFWLILCLPARIERLQTSRDVCSAQLPACNLLYFCHIFSCPSGFLGNMIPTKDNYK